MNERFGAFKSSLPKMTPFVPLAGASTGTGGASARCGSHTVRVLRTNRCDSAEPLTGSNAESRAYFSGAMRNRNAQTRHSHIAILSARAGGADGRREPQDLPGYAFPFLEINVFVTGRAIRVRCDIPNLNMSRDKRLSNTAWVSDEEHSLHCQVPRMSA